MAGSEEGESGVGYWLRWQVPVCALLLAVFAAASAAALARARLDPLRSMDLWVPRWKKVSPFWLLGLRVLSVAILCLVLIWEVLLDGASALIFYTQWTFSLVTIYFLIASVMSAHGCWIYYSKCASQTDEENAFPTSVAAEHTPATLAGTDRRRKVSNLHSLFEQSDYEQKAGFWGYLMQIAYQTSAGTVVLTDLVFWCVIVPFFFVQHSERDSAGTPYLLAFLMGCMHILNFLFLLLDTALNSLPFPWFRMAYFTLWSCVYVFFHWILHICGFSWWPYPFLDLQSPWAPLWYFGLGLIHIPCYGLYKGIAAATISFFPRIFRCVDERP